MEVDANVFTWLKLDVGLYCDIIFLTRVGSGF
jgi:hypothetical protein